ncbi:MAG: hypothetical protein ACQEQF_04900 [Bacillota bacterium]
MDRSKRIKEALEETEILKKPDKLISSSESTKMHYYVLTEPVYLEAFPEEGPETRIREGWISWDKPKLLTPDYLINMEGFSEDAKKAMKLLAKENPDSAGLLYKMNYKQQRNDSRTISQSIKKTAAKIEEDFDESSELINVIIKGVDELWDVSLMKFVQEFIIKSAAENQMPDYKNKGYLSNNKKGNPVVTRNLDGLPQAANEEIEEMFLKVKKGDLDPSVLKKELDRWGVYRQYEDRFLDLFR